jgi:hypothetical protein
MLVIDNRSVRWGHCGVERERGALWTRSVASTWDIRFREETGFGALREKHFVVRIREIIRSLSSISNFVGLCVPCALLLHFVERHFVTGFESNLRFRTVSRGSAITSFFCKLFGRISVRVRLLLFYHCFVDWIVKCIWLSFVTRSICALRALLDSFANC